jgi:CRISPR-associated endonuclease/helicase Cas3
MATAKFLIDNNATCMFLYATLPKFIRKLIEHEMGSIDFLQPSYKNDKDKQILNQKRHILGPSIDGDILSNIDLIVEETKKAMSTLVVCNHVPTAQQVYRELKGRINSTVLLHSQFCRRDRNKIENRLFKKIPKLLVSTQVVEVSLDIDFEQGFLEPAPIDAIVQRLGRINRYGKRRPTQVRIFKEQQHSFNIYDEDLTYKSLEVLSSLPSPLGEEDLNQAADRVYGKGYSYDYQIEYEEGLNYYRLKKFKKYLIAGTDQDWVDEVIDEMQCCITCEPTI